MSDYKGQPGVELTLDDPNIVRAARDKTLYWSTVHKELTHPDLFTRADRTRRRLVSDIERTFNELSESKMRKIRHMSRTLSDPEPVERLKLRLAGRSHGENHITMEDSVWIRCSDHISAERIEAKVGEIEWLESTEYSPVYVYIE
ncbi:hypothetical protein GQX73_g10308 [Xylaria multiplex]|uniref:Uncharacterized protein n=1 Tax=Xylaria multiplex TaxID=323545 RepID=A0A7C8IJP0_9PEZI|nr:hypothetical protein GQX73_g10308 [Xylaria multiplex]